MNDNGYTLAELIVVMVLLAALLMVGLPRARAWRDQAAVRAAREELAGGIAWTRIAAASAGGATLVLDPETGRFHTRTAHGEGHAVDLHRRYRVRIHVGTTEPVLIHYDALGIGRIGSRTIRIRRRSAEAGLTVSAYGRYRRW